MLRLRLAFKKFSKALKLFSEINSGIRQPLSNFRIEGTARIDAAQGKR